MYIIARVARRSPKKSEYCPPQISPPITHGVAASTHAVMIILIPFPIPYSVITSHNHIRKMVPAVIIIIDESITCKFVTSIIAPPHDEAESVFKRMIIP